MKIFIIAASFAGGYFIWYGARVHDYPLIAAWAVVLALLWLLRFPVSKGRTVVRRKKK